MSGRVCSLLVVVLVALVGVVRADPITTESLIREMTDLRALAEFPDPAFKTIQFSSYDHRSNLPGGPDWFANSDGFGSEPIPAFEAVLKEPGADGIGEYLVCDLNGPGALVRFWTAAINGRVRMWLDDASEPVFDGTADDFFRRPYNVFAQQAGTDPAVFEGTFNQQNASYCPVPFAKRCRIVWIGNVRQVHFYEVQVRLYEPDADVTGFSPSDLKRAATTIAQAAAALAHPMQILGSPAAKELKWGPDVLVEPGASAALFADESGPKAVVELHLKVTAVDMDKALRQTVLQILFDGAPHPQVEAPMGDFFGAAPGINPFDSVPFTVEADGTMICRFVMPYARTARIEAANMGEQPVSVKVIALMGSHDWNDASSMHFRARWRVDHDLIGNAENPQDLPFLVAQGKGRYVGTASILLNPTARPTPGGGWWGEGDEKIFVDDDFRPSTYGTGSEDYYNYAWSIPDIFGFAYCGQPRNDGPGNRGFVTNHRWHILDSLPFQERIAFYMELWPHLTLPGFSYARLSYHYARPGTIDDHVLIKPDDLRVLDLEPNWQPLSEGGARGSVFVAGEDCLVGDVPGETTLPENNLYEGSRLLLWAPAKHDDVVTFKFDIGEVGKYSVDLCALHSGSSGPVRLWVDDLDADGKVTQVDLSAPARHMLRRVNTEPVELEAGEHVLHVQFVGHPGEVVGIDFVWIQRRDR